jgi:hypothetical protein
LTKVNENPGEFMMLANIDTDEPVLGLPNELKFFAFTEQ